MRIQTTYGSGSTQTGLNAHSFDVHYCGRSRPASVDTPVVILDRERVHDRIIWRVVNMKLSMRLYKV